MLSWLVRVFKRFLARTGLRPIVALRPGSSIGRANEQHEAILVREPEAAPSTVLPQVASQLPVAVPEIPQTKEDLVRVETVAAVSEMQGGRTAPVGRPMDAGKQAEELPSALQVAANVPVFEGAAVPLPSTPCNELIDSAISESAHASRRELSGQRRTSANSPDERDDRIPAAPTEMKNAWDIPAAVAEAGNQMSLGIVCETVARTEQTEAVLGHESDSHTEQLTAQPATGMPSEIAEVSTSGDSGFPLSPVIRAKPTSAPSPAPYRPRLRQRSGGGSFQVRTATRPAREISALDADLVVFFQPGGWGISVSVLMRRGVGGPEEVNVRVDGASVNVLAIDDAFFEPLPLSDIEGALRDGITIETADPPPLRWIRTRRVLHVFSERPGIPGFASVPRVVIGQENVILCANEAGAEILDYCRATDSETPTEVTGPGVPSGWRCFRGYRPKRPAQEQGIEESLLALNPKPDAAIELSGGISINRGTWITDRPPAIRLVGVQPVDGELTIDGQPAILTDDGWVASNWSALGRHVIRYAGLSRSYEIVAPEDHWDTWSAHSGLQFSACGAAVSTLSGTRSIVLSADGCWLLGAHPGQTAWAAPAVYGSAIAAPEFEPVWAIFPRVGRTPTAPRLLVSNALPQQPVARATLAAMRQWRQLLRSGPPRLVAPDADALWQQYRVAARALKKWRRR